MKESKKSKLIGKIIDSMRALRVGDKVFTTRNSVWGLVPMKVVVVVSNGCTCQHTRYGTGWFSHGELLLASRITPERRSQLDLLKRTRKEVEKLETELFGKAR